MEKTNVKQKELAERLGINHIHLNAVIKGRVKPSIDLAIRIEEKSHGQYKAVDLRPDIREIAAKVK